MSIMAQDETSRSGPHRRVERILDKMSISYESEVAFKPYSVDIYVGEWHIGIEVDGPGHSANKDFARDTLLNEKYYLPILRLRSDLTVDEIMTRVEDFIVLWAPTGKARRHQYTTTIA